MKKLALLVFCVSALTVTSNAQFYMRAGAGYAFPLAGQTIDGAASLYTGTGLPFNGSRNTSGQTFTYNIKNASFSTGIQAFLGLGYMFNTHIGIQLDGVFGLSGTEYIFSDNLYVINYTSGPQESNIKMVQKANNNLMLMPSLVLQTGTDPWNIYTRFGAVLPLSTRITQHLLISNAPGTGRVVVNDFAYELKNSFSLGISSAVGVQYKINDRLSAWGELSVVAMSLYTKESEFKSFSQDGFSYPTSAVGLPAVVKYSKTAVVDSTGTTAPAYAQPFSNAGLNFGIRYNLSSSRSRRSGRSSGGMLDNNAKHKRF